LDDRSRVARCRQCYCYKQLSIFHSFNNSFNISINPFMLFTYYLESFSNTSVVSSSVSGRIVTVYQFQFYSIVPKTITTSDQRSFRTEDSRRQKRLSTKRRRT